MHLRKTIVGAVLLSFLMFVPVVRSTTQTSSQPQPQPQPATTETKLKPALPVAPATPELTNVEVLAAKALAQDINEVIGESNAFQAEIKKSHPGFHYNFQTHGLEKDAEPEAPGKTQAPKPVAPKTVPIPPAAPTPTPTPTPAPKPALKP